MFQKNFSAEPLLKKIAKIFFYLSFILCGINLLASLIMLMIDTDYALISLILFIGAALSFAANFIFALLLWGFAEIIVNTRIAPSRNNVDISKPQAVADDAHVPSKAIADNSNEVSKAISHNAPKSSHAAARPQKPDTKKQLDELLKSGAITKKEYEEFKK